MRRQEPGSTRPRPPTVGESRARDKARREREELEIQAAETAAREEQRRRTRRKAMIGGAAVVGVVGLVALGYTVLSSESESVTATCVDEQGVAVPDDVCSSAGSPNSMGMFIVAGSSYRYYYGGSNTTVGQKPVGGSTVKPQGVTVKTKSGTTIQRGGFGSKVSGTSGGS
ncbi:hypothetical protein [Rhodococcus kronopolitis]|uniref:Uncharacterized protein n=1 Tax=Rhodococcus kronopolitis TaxID=1460226 RepID=A0ABV9FNY8_9NOCA